MEKLSPGLKLGKFELKVDERDFGKVFIDGVEVPIPEPPQVGSNTSFEKIDKECPCGCGSTTPLAQSALSADGIGNDVLIKP